MPKGDGQGGNNRAEDPGPRSPDEILRAKIKLHEQAAAGEIESKESREFHAFAADKVRAELAELVERGAGMLEGIEGHGRLSEVMRADGERIEPAQIAVAELDLCDRTINGLERHDVLWASELAALTEAKVRAMSMFGAKVVEEVQVALAAVGLKLREPLPGEDAAPFPPAPQGASRIDDRASPRLVTAEKNQPALRRRLLVRLAAGASQSEAVEAAGLHKSQFGFATRLKRSIRDRLQSGDEAAQIAADEGFQPGSQLGAKIAAYIETLRTLRRHNKRLA